MSSDYNKILVFIIMDLLQILGYVVVIAFVVSSFNLFTLSKDMSLVLDGALAFLLLSGVVLKKGKGKIAPALALALMICSHFISAAKCGACAGVGVGVVLAGLRF